MLSTHTFTHDAASNLTSISVNSGLIYDANNRLISFSGSSTTFDADGNLTAWGNDTYTYDSQNRLTSAKGHTYTYTGEGVRLSNVTATTDIKYVYDTNAELSRLLQKTENGVVTKYVYGLGLIGEESGNTFKTYHFDLRGSTVAITDMSGNVTDTLAYDVYGARTSRTGTTPIIFGYNGRDGVVTDANGLLYMRARYYSPTFRRFLNADILAGSMDSSPTLNRYAYANGNPVMNVDPLGLMVTRDGGVSYPKSFYMSERTLGQKLWQDEKKTRASWEEEYYMAVLVARLEDGGLPVVGHTQLYFQTKDGEWYMTEYINTCPINFSDSSLKDIYLAKKSATILKRNVAPPVYNSETGEFQDVDGMTFVVLTGNFNKSVELAEEERYKNRDRGGYNLIYNNCSDYTDALLDVAKVDGHFTEQYLDGQAVISIPSLEVFQLQKVQKLDSIFEKVDKKIKPIERPIKTTIRVWDRLGPLGQKASDWLEDTWDQIVFWR